MAIIDQKGRLFGRINLIDLVVLVFLLALLPALYFGYRVLTKDPASEEDLLKRKESVNMTVDCQLIKLNPETLKLIALGNEILNTQGRPTGEIIGLGQSSNYVYEFDVGGGKILKREDPFLKQIEVQLKLDLEIQDGNLYYQGQALRSNLPFELETAQYKALAMPFKKTEQGEKAEIINLSDYSNVEIDCKFIRIKPELVKLIALGDRELNRDGEVIAEIIGLGQTKADLALLKELEARVRLKLELSDGSAYFKGKMLRLDSPFEFKTDKYTLTVLPLDKVKVAVEERVVDLFITLKDLNQDTLKIIAVGDKEVQNGEAIAEILTVGPIENSSLKFNLKGGTFVSAEDSEKKQIATKIRIKCQVKAEELYFKGKRVEQNQPLEFNMGEYEAKGVLSDTFEVSKIEEKWLTLRVNFMGVAPEIVNVIQKDDMEKDVYGKIIARIVSEVNSVPSKVLTIKDREFITLSHPFSKDMTLTLDVLCAKKDSTFYFKNYPVKMGNNISFSTDMYSINGLIVGLQSK